MCVSHGHRQRRMPKDFLEREDVASIHHEVTGKGMVCPGTGGQVVKSYCSYFVAQTPSD